MSAHYNLWTNKEDLTLAKEWLKLAQKFGRTPLAIKERLYTHRVWLENLEAGITSNPSAIGFHEKLRQVYGDFKRMDMQR